MSVNVFSKKAALFNSSQLLWNFSFIFGGELNAYLCWNLKRSYNTLDRILALEAVLQGVQKDALWAYSLYTLSLTPILALSVCVGIIAQQQFCCWKLIIEHLNSMTETRQSCNIFYLLNKGNDSLHGIILSLAFFLQAVLTHSAVRPFCTEQNNSWSLIAIAEQLGFEFPLRGQWRRKK